MQRSDRASLGEIFRACRTVLGGRDWSRVVAMCDEPTVAEDFPSFLASKQQDLSLPGFLPDLARVEWSVEAASKGDGDRGRQVSDSVNPTLHLLSVAWKNLDTLVRNDLDSANPEPGDALLLVWKDYMTGDVRVETATDGDLLALKIVVEELSPLDVARTGGMPVSAINGVLDRAAGKGILLRPPSSIRRGESFPAGDGIDEHFFCSPGFTLQWHITQACDLHCRHCYDRSDRSQRGLETSYRILDELYDFCRVKGVTGHISFTGGNPLLYPYFLEVYRVAYERGFGLAILGNPTARQRIEDVLKIGKPSFFQVSLEGLEEHNDAIRGGGHFRRTLDFLRDLRDLGVYSMVMLTLTSGNIDQVIPLAERLRGLADLFTFNRLSTVGEGSRLLLPPRDVYVGFLERYLDAAAENPIIGLKDNLINILHRERGVPLFGGCAGHGCSAAFNFLALLADGEVHACRKFPSLIGNMYHQSLLDIYDSEEARRYREGCEACASCSIRPVCGGCLASTYSHGLDVFRDRDPFCFIDAAQ